MDSSQYSSAQCTVYSKPSQIDHDDRDTAGNLVVVVHTMVNWSTAAPTRTSLIILCSIVVIFIATTGVQISSYKDALKPMTYFAETAVNATRSRLAPSSINPAKQNQIDVTSTDNAAVGTPIVLKNPTLQHEASLNYGSEIQVNKENVTFAANFTLSFRGEACFHFVIPEASNKCAFPYIRVRLSGSALVNVPIHVVPDSIEMKLQGCALLPVPGIYYIEVHLIHCRMNPFMTSSSTPKAAMEKLKTASGRPVLPDLTKLCNPYRFEASSFHRTNETVKNAWVFAPLCRGSLYNVSDKCSKARGRSPRYIPTKFQLDEWFKYNPYFKTFRSPAMGTRFDGYMWLPVNYSNGDIDYNADHFSYEYTPPPQFLQDDRQYTKDFSIAFVGASHVRYLKNQVSQIYYNVTEGKDGCSEPHVPPPDLENNQSRFLQIKMQFANDLLSKPKEEVLGQNDYFDKYIVTLGHWDAGYPDSRPTVPSMFLEGLLSIISLLEEMAKPSAEIFVTSVNQHPLGTKVLSGDDWRLPPLIDAYNEMIWRQVEVVPGGGPRSLKFKPFKRTYYLDNRDIVDPVWDSAFDFYHPCRYAIRPIALRVLNLVKD